MSPSRIAGAVIGALCLLAAIYLTGQARDERRIARANDAGLRGDYPGALREASRVSGEPGAGRALLARAFALEGLGRLADADQAFARVAERMPLDWTVRRAWSVLLAARGRPRAAGVQFAIARRLNPLLPLPAR